MGTVSKENMVIGFMVAKNVKREIDRCKDEVGRSRSEFIGFTIEWCVENREKISDALGLWVLQAVGAMFQEKPRKGDEELVPVQAVMSKSTVLQVDRFAAKMKLSRVNALAMLIEIGLKESAMLVRAFGPIVKARNEERQGKKLPAGRIARGTA